MHRPPCGSGVAHAYLVLPRDFPIPRAAQAGPGGLGCIRRYVGVMGPCIRRCPTWCPYPPSGPSKTEGTRVYRPFFVGFVAPCAYLVLPRGVPIPKAAKAGPEGLGRIRRCAGVAEPCVSSFSHRASLSPKRPRQDRRDSGESALYGSCCALYIPRSPAGRPHPQSGPGKTRGTRLYPPICGSGWPMHTSFSDRVSVSPKQSRQDRRDSGLLAAVWEWLHPMHRSFAHGAYLSPKRSGDRRDSGIFNTVWEWLRPVHTSFSHKACLSPKRPGQDRRDSGASAAVWEWLAHAYLVLPAGVPIPKAAQAGPGGLGCIGRRVGSAGPCIPRSPTGRPYPPSGPGRTEGTRVYSPLCGSGCALCIPRSPTGRPYPKSG